MREAIRDFQSIAKDSGAALLYSHHFAKGIQAEKSALDRASGSGVHARGCDTIITMTEHAEQGCVVMEAIARGFAPPEPMGLRWAHPIWEVDPSLDVEDLKRPGAKAKPKPNQEQAKTANLLKLVGAMRDNGDSIESIRGDVERADGYAKMLGIESRRTLYRYFNDIEKMQLPHDGASDRDA
jgi:hypothetical protein